jgi:hypothetical protein
MPCASISCICRTSAVTEPRTGQILLLLNCQPLPATFFHWHAVGKALCKVWLPLPTCAFLHISLWQLLLLFFLDVNAAAAVACGVGDCDHANHPPGPPALSSRGLALCSASNTSCLCLYSGPGGMRGSRHAGCVVHVAHHRTSIMLNHSSETTYQNFRTLCQHKTSVYTT